MPNPRNPSSYGTVQSTAPTTGAGNYQNIRGLPQSQEMSYVPGGSNTFGGSQSQDNESGKKNFPGKGQMVG